MNLARMSEIGTDYKIGNVTHCSGTITFIWNKAFEREATRAIEEQFSEWEDRLRKERWFKDKETWVTGNVEMLKSFFDTTRPREIRLSYTVQILDSGDIRVALVRTGLQ
jgi:hypothetical protein